MSVTLFDRLKTVQNPFGAMFLRQIATSDDLFGALPLVSKEGEAFSYEREVSLGGFNFIAPGGTVAKSNSKTERIMVTKREATEDFEIDNFTLDNQSTGAISPETRESAQKAKAAGRAIAGKIFTGSAVDTMTVEGFAYITDLVQASAFITDRAEPGEFKWTEPGNTLSFRAPGDREFGAGVVATGTGDITLKSDSPSKWVTITLDAATRPTADTFGRVVFSTSTNEFEGLNGMMAADRSFAASASLSFTLMDQLYDMVKNKDGQVVYVMPLQHRRKLLSLLRAVGGTEPAFVMSNGLTAPSFNGVPVLGNDYIPVDTNDSDVYCMNLTSEGSGVWLANFGGGGAIGEAADPREAPVLGFRLRDVGQSHSNSRNIWRLSWYGTPALGSDLSIARATAVSSA